MKENICITIILVGIFLRVSLQLACQSNPKTYICIEQSGRFLEYKQNIRSLYLIRCDLTNLKHSDFDVLYNARHLKVNNCSMTLSQARSLFTSYKNLETVSVSSTNIIDNTTFTVQNINLTEVEQISLQNNAIERLSNYTFVYTPKLQSLDISYNNILEIDKLAFNINGKETPVVLNLSFNALDKIDDNNFMMCNRLTNLDISHNFISSAHSDSFVGLSSLRLLDLSYNKLSLLAPRLFQPLPLLEELFLQGNSLTEIAQDQFERLGMLSRLQLSRNHIRRLDEHAFHGLYSMKNLNIADNQLTNLEQAFTISLPRLQELDLKNNSLTCLPTNAFQGIAGLMKLDLSDNRLQEIENYAFQSNIALEELLLTGNNLRYLRCYSLSGLRNLTSLDLSYNHFHNFLYLPFAHMGALRHLHLRLTSNSLCECTAYEHLKALNVTLVMDVDENDTDCKSFYQVYRESQERFGKQCRPLDPPPACNATNKDYFQIMEPHKSSLRIKTQLQVSSSKNEAETEPMSTASTLKECKLTRLPNSVDLIEILSTSTVITATSSTFTTEFNGLDSSDESMIITAQEISTSQEISTRSTSKEVTTFHTSANFGTLPAALATFGDDGHPTKVTSVQNSQTSQMGTTSEIQTEATRSIKNTDLAAQTTSSIVVNTTIMEMVIQRKTVPTVSNSSNVTISKMHTYKVAFYAMACLVVFMCVIFMSVMLYKICKSCRWRAHIYEEVRLHEIDVGNNYSI